MIYSIKAKDEFPGCLSFKNFSSGTASTTGAGTTTATAPPTSPFKKSLRFVLIKSFFCPHSPAYFFPLFPFPNLNKSALFIFP